MWPICERMGLPLVVHFHGIDAFHVKLLADNKGYARTLPNAAALVVVSHEMEEQLLELGAPRDRLHYVRYGVELDRFQAQRPDQAPPHFLSVGRFVDKKAPALTIEIPKSPTAGLSKCRSLVMIVLAPAARAHST